MASISGLGSGLDVESIITSLMSVEKLPQQKYAALKTAADARNTAWTAIAAKMSALGTAASALRSSSTSLAATTASTNSSVATATAAAGTSATSIDLIVTSLARAQQRASAGLTSNKVLAGAGTAVVATGLAAVGAGSLTAGPAATAGRHVVVVRGPGSASLTGSAAPTAAAPGDTGLTVTLGNGTTRTVDIPAGSTDTAAIVTALRSSLGDLVDVTTSSGKIKITSRETGSGSSLTLSGPATTALGLSTSPVNGDDGGVSVDGVAATLASNGGTTTATAGGLTLSFAGAMTPGTISAVVVKTDAASTVADVASQLAVAGSPVTAALVDTRDGTANSWRMVLGSRTAGSDGQISISGDALTGLSGLTTTTTAADAVLQIGGVTLHRSSNTVSDIIPGVTLNLSAIGDTTVSVTPDQSSVAGTAKDMVTALNAVLSQISTATNKDTGKLNGDSTARSLTSSLLSTGSSVTGSGQIAILSQAGISVARDGSYTIDDTKLSAALARDPDGVLSVLGSFADKLADLAGDAVKSTGTIGLAQKGAVADSASRQKQVDAYDDRLTAIEARYRKQYTALDTAMQAATAMQAQLTAQLAGLTSSFS